MAKGDDAERRTVVVWRTVEEKQEVTLHAMRRGFDNYAAYVRWLIRNDMEAFKEAKKRASRKSPTRQTRDGR